MSRTIDDVGITLKLFTASVAEVFGLLLEIINQRLAHARKVKVACKREYGMTESEHTTVLVYWVGKHWWAAGRLFQRRSDVGFIGLLGCRLFSAGM